MAEKDGTGPKKSVLNNFAKALNILHNAEAAVERRKSMARANADARTKRYRPGRFSVIFVSVFQEN